MADTWLTYADFNAAYPDKVTKSAYPALAGRAALEIEECTHWRASIADDTADLAALAQCQGLMVLELQQQDTAADKIGAGVVTSASNDGYSESYTSASAIRAENCVRIREIARKALGGPSSSWMLYEGGSFHPAGRQ